MADALKYGNAGERELTLAAAAAAGEIYQMPDGFAGVLAGAAAPVAGDKRTFEDGCDIYTLTKSTGHVILDGDEAWWDHSANAIISKPAEPGDRDFCAGTIHGGDAASGDTTCKVALNRKARHIITLQGHGFRHVPVLTAGTPELKMVGGSARAAFSATAEAQKLDLLSHRSFAIGSNWILDAIVEVVTDCDADVGDLNIGVASGTHASDANSIAESCFVHLDLGADNDIDAESDDGTNEVAATDTTINWADDTPFRLVIDGRDPSDIQIYINGALVLSGTTFNISDGSGPLRARFHLEKSSNDSPGVVLLHELNVRLMEQD